MPVTITIPDDLAEEFQYDATEGDENARALCKLIDAAEAKRADSGTASDDQNPSSETS